MKKKNDLHRYDLVGGPLCGEDTLAPVGDTLLLAASNGSYWRTPLSVLLPTRDPLLRLVSVGLWNESTHSRFAERSPL